MAGFDLPTGPNNFELCATEAVEQSNREKLLKCLAAHRIVPVRDRMADISNGHRITKLERRGDPKPKITDGLRDSILSMFSIDNEDDIEQVRRKIKNRPEWGDET